MELAQDNVKWLDLVLLVLKLLVLLPGSKLICINVLISIFEVSLTFFLINY
jgi:hypothetical protein